MGRIYRKVIGINETTGERREWDSAYQFGKEHSTSAMNVTQALDRNGVCCGWKLYDAPDIIRKRIEKLTADLQFVENL